MNNLFIILTGLSIASALFTACDKTKINNNVPITTHDSNNTTVMAANTPRLAYLNSDTLFEKYKFAIQLKGDLEAKEKQMSNELESRGKALEKEYKTLQEKAALMTANDAQLAQERIMKKQDALMQDRESLGNQLLEFNTNVNKQLADTIETFLKEYNADNTYDFIFNYTSQAPILLYKNQSLDITNEVIQQLNDRWDARKK